MQSDIVGIVILCAVSIVLLVWGILLFLGKGLRSLGGNQNASKLQIETQKKSGIGKAFGGLFVLIAIVLLFQACSMLMTL